MGLITAKAFEHQTGHLVVPKLVVHAGIATDGRADVFRSAERLAILGEVVPNNRSEARVIKRIGILQPGYLCVGVGVVLAQQVTGPHFEPSRCDPLGIQRTELFVTDYGDAFPADPAACSYEQVTFLGSLDPGIHGWDSAYLHAMYALWSPDGTKVSFLAWYGLETAPGSAFGSYDVWVADAVAETDGSISFANVHDLVSGVDGAPVLTPYNWSPDSAWFTYSRRDTTTGL